MGIKRLNYFIRQHAPDSITVKPLMEYSGTIMAIDCSILLYKYVYLSKNQYNYIIGFINRTKCYLKNNILPVYVFDGAPPEEKNITINKRSMAKKAILDKIDNLKNRLQDAKNDAEMSVLSSEITKLENQLIYVNKYHISECKEVLSAMGVPFIQAPGEAEKMCVYLQQKKLVDHIVTDDTDVFPFGCSSVLKTTLKNNSIVEYNTERILNGFQLTKEQFLDFCIMCGCDYTHTITSVGGITALNLIRKYGSLENIRDNTRYNVHFDINKIRSIFTDYTEFDEYPKFTLSEPNRTELNRLCEKFDLRKNIFNF